MDKLTLDKSGRVFLEHEFLGDVKRELIPTMKYPNIEAERARNGLTVDSLTKKLNVCRKTYYNWINCGKIPQSRRNG